ncbi:hypothetical protein Pcinc_041165, partial [Petrolisthes cinctipes]
TWGSRWNGVLVVVVVMMFGVSAVKAAIPGPTDPRYPDTIVKPRVTCEKEGSFPHPRNCSWYYRCVDRMNIGYFWTYYFECEPGTVFSDELDQCVHPHLAGPPCSDVPVTEPPKPDPIPCTGVEGTCKSYDVCRPFKQKKLLCEKLVCPLRTPHLQCADGYFFDMADRKCVKPPHPSTLCGAEVTTDITFSEQARLTCSYANTRPYSEFVSRLYCKIYPLCNNKIFTGTKELCTNYYECRREGDSWKLDRRSCPVGMRFSYAEDRCQPPPSATEICN